MFFALNRSEYFKAVLSEHMSNLKIALIDEDLERANLIQKSLIEHGFAVVACLSIEDLNKTDLNRL